MLYSTGAARGPVALTPTLSQGEREKPERSSATGWSGFAREDKEAAVSVQRGVKVIIFFLLLAVVVSMTGLVAMYFMVSRAPSVASNSVLMLRVPGGCRNGRRIRF